MNILVFGKTGQVARELQAYAQVTALDRDQANLNDPAGCAAVIASQTPAIVINAAAYTGVDAAESDHVQAELVNSQAPKAIAQACAAFGIPLIHISTDYVFPGGGERPWKPSDATGPLGVYGATKLAGEEAVRAAGGPHVILRTSWVFSAHGRNFVKTMLQLSETRDALNVVSDQIGGPTPAAAIASACIEIADQLRMDPHKSGTYHFAGAPNISWCAFAQEIFARARRDVTVTGIPSSEYQMAAVRPLNSRLDCSTTTKTFGIARPDWLTGLDLVLEDLGLV
jgi:dTDP-4-dehydrorhamnose reductase